MPREEPVLDATIDALRRRATVTVPLRAGGSRTDLGAANPALSVEPNRNPRCSPMFAGLIAANHGGALGGAFGASDGLAGVENRSDDECRC